MSNETASKTSAVETNDKREDPNNAPVDDTNCEGVDDTVDDIGSDYGDDTDAEAKKFSSPEAGAERLNKLDPKVRQAMENLPIETSFNAYIEAMKSRCADLRANSSSSFEMMLTQRACSDAMTFRRTHFNRQPAMLSRIADELTQYLQTAPWVDILQTFIDVVQQGGHEANMHVQSLEAVENTNQRQYDDAKARRTALYDLYHDLVTLYRHCTGTWKPARRFNNQYNGGQRTFRADQQDQSFSGERNSSSQRASRTDDRRGQFGDQSRGPAQRGIRDAPARRDQRDNRSGDQRDNRSGDQRDNRSGNQRDNRSGDQQDNRKPYYKGAYQSQGQNSSTRGSVSGGRGGYRGNSNGGRGGYRGGSN